MSQATVEEDGVSWIDEGGSGPCPDTGLESSNLSPAEVNTDGSRILHTLLVKHYNDLHDRQSSERGKDEVTYFYVGYVFCIHLGTKYDNFQEKILAEKFKDDFLKFDQVCKTLNTAKYRSTKKIRRRPHTQEKDLNKHHLLTRKFSSSIQIADILLANEYIFYQK